MSQTEESGMNLNAIVTEALMGMIAAVTSTTPPANEPPPQFIQSAIDRAVERIRAGIQPVIGFDYAAPGTPKSEQQLTGITWEDDPHEANAYHFIGGNRWVAKVQMNGEMLVAQQEAILNAMVAASAQQPGAIPPEQDGSHAQIAFWGGFESAAIPVSAGGVYSADPLACSGCVSGCFRCRAGGVNERAAFDDFHSGQWWYLELATVTKTPGQILAMAVVRNLMRQFEQARASLTASAQSVPDHSEDARGMVPDGYVLVPVERIAMSLETVQNAMEDAYRNAYQDCCGRGNGQCCGNPVASWSDADQAIMDALAPSQRELSALIAAPAPGKGGAE